MSPALHTPFALFRFAIRDEDWPLAAALARALFGSRTARRQLARDLAASELAGAPSLLGLRTLALVLRSLPFRGDRG